MVAQVAVDRSSVGLGTLSGSLGTLSGILLTFAVETRYLQRWDIEALESSGRITRALVELERTLLVR